MLIRLETLFLLFLLINKKKSKYGIINYDIIGISNDELIGNYSYLKRNKIHSTIN